jgi:hypothetical protein
LLNRSSWFGENCSFHFRNLVQSYKTFLSSKFTLLNGKLEPLLIYDQHL